VTDPGQNVDGVAPSQLQQVGHVLDQLLDTCLINPRVHDVDHLQVFPFRPAEELDAGVRDTVIQRHVQFSRKHGEICHDLIVFHYPRS